MDYQALDPEIARQQLLAQQLRGQSQSQSIDNEGSGRMVGRYFVRQSPFAQGAASIIDHFANKASGEAFRLESQKRGQIQDTQRQWAGSLPEAVAGHSELAGPQAEGGSPELASAPGVPLTSGRILKHALEGLAIPGNEKSAALYSQGALADLTREDNQQARAYESNANRVSTETLKREQLAQQAEIQREQTLERERAARLRSEDMRLSIDQRREAAREAVAARREIAAIVAGSKGGGGKSLPAAQAKAWIENETALGKIDRAREILGQSKGSFGLKNYAPDLLTQRMDPKGVAARAAISDIGSLKIHDRSGAAVSASEDKRLKPFVPLSTDSPDTIAKKLDNFVAEYEMIQQEIGNYADDQGYKRPVSRRGATAPASTPPTDAGSAPPGPVSSPAGATSPGASRTVNGKTYVFDGKGWLAK